MAVDSAKVVLESDDLLACMDQVFRLIDEVESDPFFLQIGAMDGVMHDPINPFVSTRDWRGVLMEPIPEMFSRLKANYSGKKNLIFENSALTLLSGKVEMIKVDPDAIKRGDVGEWAQGISALSSVGGMTAHSSVRDFTIVEMVDGISLGDLVKKHAIEKIDFLQIDAEGSEKNILEAFDFTKFLPYAINVEIAHMTHEILSEVQAGLKDNGYMSKIFGGEMLSIKLS